MSDKEIRYTPEGYELRHGQKVWTRKLLRVSFVKGELIRQKYGVYAGIEKRADGPYVLRYTRREKRCRSCGQIIYPGEMCAAGKYCLDCILPFEPERDFQEFPW